MLQSLKEDNQEKNQSELIQILMKTHLIFIKIIVRLYSLLWFEIKVKHSWIEGPYHILKQLQLVRLQPKKVQDIVLPYLNSSAWNAHSENLLQTLLCSSDSGDRRFAVDTICKLHGSSEFGDFSVRYIGENTFLQ